MHTPSTRYFCWFFIVSIRSTLLHGRDAEAWHKVRAMTCEDKQNGANIFNEDCLGTKSQIKVSLNAFVNGCLAFLRNLKTNGKAKN